MKCMICDREAIANYCVFHQRAYLILVQKFAVWKRATGVPWREYLKELMENSYTGAWAKEVAQHVLKNKDDINYG